MRQTNETKDAQVLILKLIDNFLKDYFEEVSLPVQKFIRQMLFGIIKSRSVIVQRVAVSLCEKISLKKCCDRLYRNLSKCSVLHELLMDAQIKAVSAIIKPDTGIIIDLSDVSKPGATKMQGLDYVWDGSKSTKGLGYFTLQASVCHYTNPRNIKLLYSDIFSLEKESTSENTKILDLIHAVIVNTNNDGIFIMDRGMDRGIIIKDLIENDVSFIIRGNTRHLEYQGKIMSYRSIAEKMHLDHTVKSKKRTFAVGIVPVKFIMPNDEASKNQRKQKSDLFLVVGLEPGHSYVYYLCRFRNKYSPMEMASLVVRYYGLRWSIEEVHRQIKCDLNWENVQLLKYWSLKNMNALLWISASFIYNEVGEATEHLIKIFSHRLIYRNSYKEKGKLMTYRLTSLISDLFSSIDPRRLLRKRKENPARKRKEDLQLCLDF